jgi:hypothetical protein
VERAGQSEPGQSKSAIRLASVATFGLPRAVIEQLSQDGVIDFTAINHNPCVRGVSRRPSGARKAFTHIAPLFVPCDVLETVSSLAGITSQWLPNRYLRR